MFDRKNTKNFTWRYSLKWYFMLRLCVGRLNACFRSLRSAQRFVRVLPCNVFLLSSSSYTSPLSPACRDQSTFPRGQRVCLGVPLSRTVFCFEALDSPAYSNSPTFTEMKLRSIHQGSEDLSLDNFRMNGVSAPVECEQLWWKRRRDLWTSIVADAGCSYLLQVTRTSAENQG